MMNAHLSPKEWQLLSEYMDGTLPPRERDRVEKLLATQPGLRDDLESLRQTRTLLRSVPKRRVPRSFALTPEMAAARPAPFLKLFNRLSLATGVAALLILLTFLVQGLPVGAPAAAPAPQVALEAPSAQKSGAVESTEPPAIIYWGYPGGGMGGGGASEPMQATGLGGGPPASDQAPATKQGEEPVTPPEGLLPVLPETQTPEATPAGPSLAAPAAGAPAPTEQPTQAVRAAAPQVENSGPILGIRPAGEEGRILPSQTAPAPAEQPAEAPPSGTPMLVRLRIALGVIAALAALGAAFAWWKSRA